MALQDDGVALEEMAGSGAAPSPAPFSAQADALRLLPALACAEATTPVDDDL
jgi:hypothetical protein